MYFVPRTPILSFIPYQSLSEEELDVLGVTVAACKTGLHVIDGQTVIRGAEAMNRLLVLAGHPLGKIIEFSARCPLILECEERAYRLFVSNRYYVSRLLYGKACNLKQS